MKKFLLAVIEQTQPLSTETARHLLYFRLLPWPSSFSNFMVPRFIASSIQFYIGYEIFQGT